jgi:hypothetical protein
VKILCANRSTDGTFHVWVGRLSLWGDVDYVASMTRGMSDDMGYDELRSLQLYHEDFTDLVVGVGGER